MVLGERTDYQIPQGMGLRSLVFGAQELRYLTPWNQVNGKIWNSQIGTKLTKVQLNKKNTAESTENIFVMKRLLKIKAYKMTSHHISRHFVSSSFEK